MVGKLGFLHWNLVCSLKKILRRDSVNIFFSLTYSCSAWMWKNPSHNGERRDSCVCRCMYRRPTLRAFRSLAFPYTIRLYIPNFLTSLHAFMGSYTPFALHVLPSTIYTYCLPWYVTQTRYISERVSRSVASSTTHSQEHDSSLITWDSRWCWWWIKWSLAVKE